MGFFDRFRKPEQPADGGEPKAARPEPILPYDTVISITELDGQVLGDGVIHDSNDIEGSMHITRKTGDLKLPDLAEGSSVRLCGCIHNKPFGAAGTVAFSSRTELVLKDVKLVEAANKRSNFRVYVEEKATVTTPEGTRIHAEIRNISTTGAYIVCQQEMLVDSLIHLEALLSNKERKWKIDTDAEVVRAATPIEKYGRVYYGYGVLFPQFDDRELHKMTQWLNMMQTASRKL